MSSGHRSGSGRSRFFVGLVALLGVGLLLAVVGLVRLLRPAGVEGEAVERAGAGGTGLPALVKGTGTSWSEETSASARAVLEGTVLDGQGKPLDGARVTLGRLAGPSDEAVAASFMKPRATTSSAGGGRFRVEKLAPGEYTVTATLEGWLPGLRGSVALQDGETTTIELRLESGGVTLQGRVLDVGGGGVGGAQVTLLARGMSTGRAPALLSTVADGEGRYRLAVARGQFRLQAEAEGYAPATDEVFVVQGITRDVRLVPAARLTGRVVERGSGRPVPQAEVSLTSASRMDFRPPREVKADGEGRFEITGLDPGTFELMARKGTLIGVSNVVGLAVAQALEGVEVPVDAGRAISGRVTDGKGAGVGGVRVSAGRDSPPFGQAARTRTNPDGSYALEGILPGAYRLTASDERFGQGAVSARLLGTDLRGMDLVLPPRTKVSGKVVSAEGRPVSGARVSSLLEMSRSGGGMMTTGEVVATGEDGGFTLLRMAAGKMRLSARHDQLGMGVLPAIDLVAGDEKVVELRLGGGGSVAGVVTTDDGKPAPGVRVSAMAREMGMALDAQDVTAPDGSYRLAGLPAANMMVAAARGRVMPGPGQGDEPHQEAVTLAAGEHKRGVNLVVGPAGLSLRGSTQGPDGKPVPGAIVAAAPERNGRAFRGQARDLKGYSNLDAQWSIENINPGTYTVWASHPDFPEAELKGVTPGPAALTVTFPAPASVSGVVLDADGKPVPHYTIAVMPPPAANESANDRRRRQLNSFDVPTHRVQSPDGAFQLRPVAAGAHELAISSAEGGTATEVVELQAGEKKTGLRIQLQSGLRVSGRVLEYGSGRPLPGITVAATGAGSARVQTEVAPDGSFTLPGAPAGEMVMLLVSGDASTHVMENKQLDIKKGQTTADAGVIHLLPGNQRERMMGPSTERAYSGLVARRDGARLLVRAVGKETAAARAGVKDGDVLHTIQGKDTAQLGNGAIMFLTTGKPGDKIDVAVSSAGAAPRVVTITLEATSPPSAAPQRSN